MRFIALFLAAAALPVTAGIAASATPTAAMVPTRFSVTVAGNGPDVIFIPGLSSTRAVWAASIDKLSATHRVHLVQLKGFGEPAGPNASGPVLEPFVDELAAYARDLPGKPAVVGHSMGGLAALMLAADHPGSAGKVLIVDSFAFIGPVFGAADVAAITPHAERMRTMMLGQASKVTPDFNARADCPESLPAPAAALGSMTNSGAGACMMKHGATASDMRVVAQAMYDDMVTDMRPRLKDITVPVTVLYPQDDRLLPAAQANKMYAESYAGTGKLTLVRIPGSYHFIMQDQPARFRAELERFLK